VSRIQEIINAFELIMEAIEIKIFCGEDAINNKSNQ